jgi:hypothetical protein
MIRLQRALVAAGVALAVAACSDSPAAPSAAPVAARDVTPLAAPAPTVACTVALGDTPVDVRVTWSGFSATGITIHQGTENLVHSDLRHPTRNGDVTLDLPGGFLVGTAPFFADLIGRQGDVTTQQCST